MLGISGSGPGKSAFAYKGLLTIILLSTLLTAPLATSAQRVYATSQANAVTGLCILCGVSNPANPVNNANLNDYSTYNITVGLLGVSVYQDLVFPGVNANQGCDSLVVGIGNNGALLTAALLGGVTIQTYNGSTANNDVTTVNGNILRLLSTDTTRGEVVLRPTASFDRVRISLNSSLVGALSNFRLYYAFTDKTILPPAIQNGGSTVTVCAGSPVTFTASDTVTAATIAWYAQASGGSPIATGNSLTVTPTVTTTYYAEAHLGSCTSPSRTPVTVVVNPLPTTPALVSAAVTVCSGSPATFMVQSPQAGTTYNWYTVSTGGTPVATGTSFTTSSTSASQNYYLEAVSATTGCASASRATAALTVNPTPDSTVIAGASSVTVNQGQTATFSVSAPNPAFTYNWYDAPTGGNLVATGTSFTTAPVFAPTSYYVGAVSNTGCTSATRTRVTVNVLTPNNITCGLATTQTSPVISGICVACTVSSGPLAVDGDPSTASTITSTIGALGTVGQLLGFPNTYPAGDSIVLDLQIPGATLSASLLGGVTVQTYLNGTANNDAVNLADTVIRLQLLGGGSTGRFRVIIPSVNTFNAVQVSIGGAVTLLSALNVFDAAALVPRPTAASTLIQNCGPASDTLRATGPPGATFNWYTVAAGGTPLATGTTYVTPVLSANTTYYLESSRFACPNAVRTSVTVAINTPPAAPVLNTPSVTICAGDSATLAAGNAARWYATPTGGSSLDSAAAFTTPALNSTTIYYAEAVSGGCISTTRSPDTVKVNPVPQAVAVSPSGTTISAGQSASLTASSTTPGVQYNWYTQSTGGAPVFSGPTYTVAPTTTTTYYVSAVIPSTGCTNTTRTAVTVAVLTGNGPAVPCGAATTETTAVNGLCIGCSVSNEALAVDGNATTGSTLNVTVGLLGGNAQQTLIFPFTADAGDSISIKFAAPNTTLSLSLLGSLQVATFDGNNANNDQQSLGSPLISLNLLAGGDSAVISFAPAKPYDRVQVQLNAGLAGLLSTINIDYATSTKPAPVLQADTVSVCSGNQATLKAVAPPDAIFRWYTTPTGGTPVFTGATFQTPVLTDTTVYYAESAATINGCVQSTRTQALVDVPAPPTPPAVQHNSVSVCMGGSATLIATTPAGVTVNWYTVPTGGTPVFTGDTLVTPALDSTRTYYAEAVGQTGCASATRTTVTANIVAAPAAPTVTPATDTICAGGSVQLVASSSTPGVQLNWYASATSDTVLFIGSTYTTPILDSNATFYVAAAAGACQSATRGTAAVIVNPRPPAPTINVNPASATVNAGATATLTATTTGAAVSWYTTPTGGSPVFTGLSFTTPPLTSTITYYAESEGVSGCPSAARAAVTITVTPGINVSCGIANQQTSQVSGLCIGCSVINPGGAVDMDTTTFSTLGVGVSVAGTVSQTLIFPETSQPGDSIQIALSTPGASLLSAGVLAAIQVSTANGATQNNDAQSINTAAITLNVLASGNKAFIRFAPGQTYDRVTVTLTAGLVSALTNVEIFYATDQVDAPVVANQNMTVCSGTPATLVASASANAAIEWFSTPVGGVALGAGDTLVTPPLTQTTTYYAEALRRTDSCANLNRVPVTVSVVAAPVAPAVSPNPDTICAGSSAILRATATGGANIFWYDSARGGNLLFTGNVFTTPALSSAKSYFAAASNGTCSSISRDSVSVVVGQTPQTPVVGPADTGICSGQMITLRIAQPQSGVTYNWYTVLSGGTPVATGTTFTTPVLNSSVTYYAEAVNSASQCTAPSARTAVSITVSPVPAAPTVTAAQVTTCAGQPVTAAVSNPQTGVVYQWYDASTGGNLLSTGASYTIASATASGTLYVQAVSGGGCSGGTRTAVSIVVDSVPTAPQLVSTNVGVCAGSPATFTIAAPQTGVTYTWYDAPSGGNLLTTGSSYTTGPLAASATYYIAAVNTAGCGTAARTAVNANVTQTPSAPTVTTPSAVICSGGSASLSIQNPQAGTVYNWYDAPSAGNLVFQGNPFVTPALTTGTTYYVAAADGQLGCTSATRTPDAIVIGSQPATPTLTTASVQVCAGANVSLQVQNPVAGLVYNWLSSPTAATPLFTGPSYTITGDTVSGTYYVAASTSGGCTSASDAVATVTVNPAPGTPAVQSPNLTVCPGNAAVFSISNPQPGVTYNWYASASGGTPLSAGSSFSTGPLAAGAMYFVGATNAGGCSSPGLTTVTVTVANNLTPPQLATSQVTDCSGQPAQFMVANPQGGLTYNWYDAPSGGNLVFTGSTYTINGPVASDTFYVGSSASGGACVSATRTIAILTVAPLPTAPSVITPGAQVCSGGSVSLQVSNPVSGDTYNWYAAATGGSPVFTGTIYNLTNVTASGEYFVETVSGGCSSPTRTPVSVDIAAAAASPTVTASSTGICPGSDATLMATSTTAGATFSWYTSAAGGTPVATGPSFTTGALISDTTFYVGAASAQGCSGTTLTPISLAQLQPLAPPTVTVQTRTPTSVTFQWTPVTGAVAYQVSLDSGTTFITPTSGPTGLTETITNLAPNQTATVEVKALGAAPCQTSTASARASGVSDNPLGDNIFVPNVFSPNGDGNNDVLYVYSNAIATMVFRIYNQWGQEVFESRSVNTGWDGTMGGQKQPVGVYVYVLQATMQDGTVVNKKGSVTLIR
ncbi:MAG TPA: gliding motility-associated C-terminal domain-containing protein [Dinghuibacter sp.]|jgi:gliding motility-associated-like protein|uniref:Ig-like domain-containing protein n=1 Tax=Dinghuibacter sp. TaxID=2024697 RepID=UPI002BD53C03|nr:gliding motility-associated C-terminal domain-containing protein [Dinghuibacter sp.]HTJ12415.1 gliding motility-associated C-terminal domain-containing protein [Dinghuibacter sp.]